MVERMGELKDLVAARLAEAEALPSDELRALAAQRETDPSKVRMSTASGHSYSIAIKGGVDDDAGHYDDEPNIWIRIEGRGTGTRWWDQYQGSIGRFNQASMVDCDDIDLTSIWADRRDGLIALALLLFAIVPWLTGIVYVIADLVSAAT